MSEERPFLQVPMPTPRDWHAYREWVRREQEKAEEKENADDERVVVIQV
jgi:hypothetical protein